jgi:hypothetical protein
MTAAIVTISTLMAMPILVQSSRFRARAMTLVTFGMDSGAMSVDADRRIAQPISHAFVTLLLQAVDRTVAKFALSFLARSGRRHMAEI